MLCLFYVIPVYVVHVFPRDSIMKPILVISIMSPIWSRESVCICMHLRRFSDILNLQGVQVIRNVSPRGYDMP